MNVQDYSRRIEEYDGWTLNVVSYRRGETYHCTVDNVDPGAVIARATGSTREGAERRAVVAARRRLNRTRRFPPASG